MMVELLRPNVAILGVIVTWKDSVSLKSARCGCCWITAVDDSVCHLVWRHKGVMSVLRSVHLLFFMLLYAASIQSFSYKTPTPVNSNGMHDRMWLSSTLVCFWWGSVHLNKTEWGLQEVVWVFCAQLATTNLFLWELPYYSNALVWINSLVYVCMVPLWRFKTTKQIRQHGDTGMKKKNQRKDKRISGRLATEKRNFMILLNGMKIRKTSCRRGCGPPQRKCFHKDTGTHALWIVLLLYLLPATGCLQLRQ